MTTRASALITIGLIAVLLAVVALAALFAGEISERAGGIVSTVLGSFATVLAGLLLFLRVETVNAKVENVDTKVAEATQKVESVHHDLLNGGLRENVKRANLETEADPTVRALRIDNAARGVSKDRHEKLNREAAEQGRAQLEARRKQQGGGEVRP